jgi:hypothetical protein
MLEDAGTWGFGPFGGVGAPIVVPVSLGDSPGSALEAASAERKRSGLDAAIVASPLVAKAIAAGGAWSGDPPLLVPEWRGKDAPGLQGFATDPAPAYRAAGEAAGAYIAALAEGGGSPSCGILFAEAPNRPRSALVAFSEAYAKSSGGRALELRELGKGDPASEPQGATASDSQADARAEAAVSELLGTDLRLLFVALGPGSEAAIRAAARPGLALGADFPHRGSPPVLAFRVEPDDAAMAKALASRVRAPRDASPKGGTSPIPAILAVEPRASVFRAGKVGLKGLIEGAALRAKAPR